MPSNNNDNDTTGSLQLTGHVRNLQKGADCTVTIEVTEDKKNTDSKSFKGKQFQMNVPMGCDIGVIIHSGDAHGDVRLKSAQLKGLYDNSTQGNYDFGADELSLCLEVHGAAETPLSQADEDAKHDATDAPTSDPDDAAKHAATLSAGQPEQGFDVIDAVETLLNLLLTVCWVALFYASWLLVEDELKWEMMAVTLLIFVWLCKSLASLLGYGSHDADSPTPVEDTLSLVQASIEPLMFFVPFYLAEEYQVSHLLLRLTAEARWAVVLALFCAMIAGIMNTSKHSIYTAKNAQGLVNIIIYVCFFGVSFLIWDAFRFELLLIGSLSQLGCNIFDISPDIGALVFFFSLLSTEYQLRSNLISLYV